jgi:hypothetical protein
MTQSATCGNNWQRLRQSAIESLRRLVDTLAMPDVVYVGGGHGRLSLPDCPVSFHEFAEGDTVFYVIVWSSKVDDAANYPKIVASSNQPPERDQTLLAEDRQPT